MTKTVTLDEKRLADALVRAGYAELGVLLEATRSPRSAPSRLARRVRGSGPS